MALAHFHAGTVSRASGRSAVDAAAYVLRANMLDQRTGHSYSNGRNAADAVHTFVWLPKNAPEQYRDGEALANYMESRETRKNSRTARTFEGALPHELTDEQRLQLVKDISREFTRKGLAVIVGIHRPHSHGDERNHHFHMVVSTRTMDAKGLGEKLRDLDKVETLEHWRSRFETLTNKKLEQHGHEARVDLRSYEKQGRDQTAQSHIGPVAAALERKGIETDRGNQVRGVIVENAERGRVLANDNVRPEKAAEPEQGSAWTAGRPRRHELTPEAVPVVSAVDRQRQEDQEERTFAQREAAIAEARAVRAPLHLRMMAAAFRSLGVTSGQMVANVMGRADADTIAASMRAARREELARIEERKANELARANAMSVKKAVRDLAQDISSPAPQTDPALALAADAPKIDRERQKTWMAQSGGYDQLPDQLKDSAEASYAKWKTATPKAAAGVEISEYVRYVQGKENERAGQIEEGTTQKLRRGAQEQPRTFVDRGNRPPPYRAMLGELRGGEQDGGAAIGVPVDRAGDRVWSHEKQDVVSPASPRPTTSSKQSGFIERLEAQQKAKGQTLADLLPKKEREKQQDQGLGLDLEL